MLTRLLHRRRAAVGEAGISLVEVLVAMTLSMILGAITMTLAVKVSSSSSDSTDRTISSEQSRNVMQAWSGYLQVADDPTSTGTGVSRFEWFTASSILFYSDLNNRSGSLATTGAPTMVWLRLDSASQLVEEKFVASPSSYPAAPSSCRILNFKVTATKLFTPINAGGFEITNQSLGTSPTVGSGCQSLPSAPPSKTNKPDASVIANLQNVAAVSISFTTRDTRNSHPLSFTTTLLLPPVAGV